MNPWKFEVKRQGKDIIIPVARATCFGGADDPEDNGDTASGISTKANPEVCACSLPMRYTGKNPRVLEALGDSPLPRMPWLTMVHFKAGGASIIVPVIDRGPAKRTGNAIDLTIAAARKINPKATARDFSAIGFVRIVGGAKYL